MKKVFTLFLTVCLLGINFVAGQTADTSKVKGEYPYILPILGKKAHARGITLQKPFGLMLGGIFNSQEIVLNNFEMAIDDPGTPDEDLNFINLDSLGVFNFGPSEGRVSTFNVRADVWLLPFFSVGGYYGRVYGEQTISFSFLGSDLIYSNTPIEGQYYGFNMLAAVPLGPVALMADYSWSWTTNPRLDEPVLVEVSGIRVVRRIMTKKENRFFAVWAGTQFQKLNNETSGRIAFDEALGISEEDKQQMDDAWADYKTTDEWDQLSPGEKLVKEAGYKLIRGIADDEVAYKFNKELKYNWNFLLGVNYQHNPSWQFRAEWGFLKSKQQIFLGANYRFGL